MCLGYVYGFVPVSFVLVGFVHGIFWGVHSGYVKDLCRYVYGSLRVCFRFACSRVLCGGLPRRCFGFFWGL